MCRMMIDLMCLLRRAQVCLTTPFFTMEPIIAGRFGVLMIMEAVVIFLTVGLTELTVFK